ncbi:MAG: response regulator, partial [Gallionella sp.]|nr:response regulator [Gallionella sp.]
CCKSTDGGGDMTDKGKILAVDDTPASLKLLTDILKAEGYEVRSAISGELALHAAASNPPELVLLDIRMPEMDGFEVCRRLKADPRTCTVPVIFVSAVTETDEKVEGFKVGAVDFVTKPYQRDELLARVHTHLELNRLRNQLEDLVKERTAQLMDSEKKLRASLIDSITALAAIVEMRDPYTSGHQRRVAHLAIAIAKELQMPAEQIEGIHLAGVVHDIGKIQIPAEILSKPGHLTKMEFELVKQHAQSGYEILKSIDFPWPIAQIVQQHHERLDGSGYPQALGSAQILIESKIVAVADVVESMMSHRPYRPGLGIDAALEEIELNKGKLFDPLVVDACTKLFKERGYVIPN